jgi:hypothetical protein
LAVPPVIPVTVPDASTVAILVLELVHTPPASPPEVDKNVVNPKPTVNEPVILPASGNGVIVMTAFPLIGAVHVVDVLVAKTV